MCICVRIEGGCFYVTKKKGGVPQELCEKIVPMVQ